MSADQSAAGRPITGHTQLAAVIGSPVRHSISPAIHNAAFAALDLDWVYVAFDVREGATQQALDAVRALGIRGLSVTMPHKTAVADAVDELTDAARALRAVNCVVNRDGWLVGDNTDGAGFVDAFRHDTGGDLAGRRCGVIGGGGAARAVVRAIAVAGAAEVIVVNRSAPAAAVAADLAGPCGRVGTIDDLSRCDVVINATPLGMAGPSAASVPMAGDLLQPGQILVDLVYNPLETVLIRNAKEQGKKVIPGVKMFIEQAVKQFELWTGETAPRSAMETAALDALHVRHSEQKL